MGKNNVEWETEAQREAPYWVDGMTPEEYDTERKYYLIHYDDIRSGKLEYVPLDMRGV